MSQDSSVVIAVRQPSSASTAELSAFKEFVLVGGEVNSETLPGLLLRALSLGFARIDGELVAVAGIKRPNLGYRAGAFRNSGALHDPAQFEFEFGWVYVHPSARGKGVATALVEALVPTLNGACAYATSRLDNVQMHAALKKFGFKTVGAPYPSKLNEPEIQLFLCE